MYVNKELKTISPLEAKKYLRLNTYKGQRNLSKDWCVRLAYLMEKEEFHTGSIAILHQLDGSKYLIDGQHQCHASVISNKIFDVILQNFYVDESDNPVQAAAPFTRFNTDKSRTKSELVWGIGCGTGFDTGWSRSNLSRVASALLCAEGGEFEPRPKNAKKVCAIMPAAYPEECDFLRKLLFSGKRGRPASHLRKIATMSAIINCWRKEETGAEVFWIGVRDGELLEALDPEFLLRDFLKSINNTSKASVRIDQVEIYSKCISAWNAYRKGKTLKILKCRRGRYPNTL